MFDDFYLSSRLDKSRQCRVDHDHDRRQRWMSTTTESTTMDIHLSTLPLSTFVLWQYWKGSSNGSLATKNYCTDQLPFVPNSKKGKNVIIHRRRRGNKYSYGWTSTKNSFQGRVNDGYFTSEFRTGPFEKRSKLFYNGIRTKLASYFYRFGSTFWKMQRIFWVVYEWIVDGKVDNNNAFVKL